MGEQVLDLVIPYIQNTEDRNSVCLVSHRFYETDAITRKRLTVHTLYYPNPPPSLTKRFPSIESLTLKGPPFDFNGYVIRLTPWIQQLALEFSCLKELHLRHLVVHDEDLEKLATTRGKDLRTLTIKMCEEFSTDGLMHVSKYCNQLKTLCLLGHPNYIQVKDGVWLHQLALNSTVLEMFKFKNTDVSDAQHLTLLAKNCCNSLTSLRIGNCSLSKLGDAFRYAVRLEHFSGHNSDNESDLVGFQFPPNMRSISIRGLPVTRCSIVFPFLNRIRKLNLLHLDMDEKCQCLLFKRCPNLEVLSTCDLCGDKGLQVIGQFCKKLRKLTYDGLNVTHVGLIALVKGCANLESLTGFLRVNSNEALKCVGTHLKNLRHFHILLENEDCTRNLRLDNGVRAMLKGCSKLERLYIFFLNVELTDVGLEYVGKYGANLRFLSLICAGKSDAGLVKLSEGCPRLRKLKLTGCPFSKQAVVSSVFNIPSLRYVWFESWDHGDDIRLALTRPKF
ncbi:hypothetical protein CTI12_AA146810 [Artemisia annua]|uniref:COI1 F-box domain-containing protein n=1 Tax=Artemisia annua TaxID=35608 RepID=A0A2U1PIP1_ARTAN|nr:hypothetical protein CTI12_AA146810 [Artemisia annua]